MKSKTARDGWDGPGFRRLRITKGWSRERLASATQCCVRTLENYERNKYYPSHRWRDRAALALRVQRHTLGVPTGRGR